MLANASLASNASSCAFFKSIPACFISSNAMVFIASDLRHFSIAPSAFAFALLVSIAAIFASTACSRTASTTGFCTWPLCCISANSAFASASRKFARNSSSMRDVWRKVNLTVLILVCKSRKVRRTWSLSFIFCGICVKTKCKSACIAKISIR